MCVVLYIFKWLNLYQNNWKLLVLLRQHYMHNENINGSIFEMFVTYLEEINSILWVHMSEASQLTPMFV